MGEGGLRSPSLHPSMQRRHLALATFCTPCFVFLRVPLRVFTRVVPRCAAGEDNCPRPEQGRSHGRVQQHWAANEPKYELGSHLHLRVRECVSAVFQKVHVHVFGSITMCKSVWFFRWKSVLERNISTPHPTPPPPPPPQIKPSRPPARPFFSPPSVEIARLVEAFFSGDKDYDGLLDVKELTKFLKSRGGPGESAHQLATRCVWERACHECGMLVAYGVRLSKPSGPETVDGGGSGAPHSTASAGAGTGAGAWFQSC